MEKDVEQKHGRTSLKMRVFFSFFSLRISFLSVFLFLLTFSFADFRNTSSITLESTCSSSTYGTVVVLCQMYIFRTLPIPSTTTSLCILCVYIETHCYYIGSVQSATEQSLFFFLRSSSSTLDLIPRPFFLYFTFLFCFDFSSPTVVPKRPDFLFALPLLCTHIYQVFWDITSSSSSSVYNTPTTITITTSYYYHSQFPIHNIFYLAILSPSFHGVLYTDTFFPFLFFL